METTVMTYEEFLNGKAHSPEMVKAYLLYLKENGKSQWFNDKTIIK